MKIVLHRSARTELIAAAQYLDAEAGLGADFLERFDAWLQQIRSFPESGPLIGQYIRKGVLTRFNYVIAYEVRADYVRVLYVRHAKQKRPDWGERR